MQIGLAASGRVCWFTCVDSFLLHPCFSSFLSLRRAFACWSVAAKFWWCVPGAESDGAGQASHLLLHANPHHCATVRLLRKLSRVKLPKFGSSVQASAGFPSISALGFTQLSSLFPQTDRIDDSPGVAASVRLLHDCLLPLCHGHRQSSHPLAIGTRPHAVCVARARLHQNHAVHGKSPAMWCTCLFCACLFAHPDRSRSWIFIVFVSFCAFARHQAHLAVCLRSIRQ